MKKLENFDTMDKRLRACNLRIICVVLLQSVDCRCVYRVYCNDGGFTEYVGFERLPKYVRDWISLHNSWEYVTPSCMLVSGVKVV